MKKALLLLSTLMLTASLTACGSDKTAIKDDNPAQAKVEETAAPAAEPAAEPVVEEVKEEAPSPDDIWTYYDNATWSDDFNGVKSSIETVVVTDQAPKDYDENNLTASAVGVKFKIENTTDKLWTTYPIVTPFSVGNQQPLTTVSAATSIVPAYFSVPAGYGHGKFYFLNNGTSNLTVTMTHSSGLEYIAATVKPGAAYTWRSTAGYAQGMRGGDYTISFHCSSGVNAKWSAFASNSVTEANA